MTAQPPSGAMPPDANPPEPAPPGPAPPVGVQPEPGPPTGLPPDPDAYDSPRAVRARAKGLDAPYIAGGDDPDPGPALAEERRLGRVLVVMAVTIVAAGFVIGTLIALLGPAGGR